MTGKRPVNDKEYTKMSKSKEELNALKKEVEAVNEKLQELTPEEIAQVNGGIVSGGPEPVIKPVGIKSLVTKPVGFEDDDCR